MTGIGQPNQFAAREGRWSRSAPETAKILSCFPRESAWNRTASGRIEHGVIEIDDVPHLLVVTVVLDVSLYSRRFDRFRDRGRVDEQQTHFEIELRKVSGDEGIDAPMKRRLTRGPHSVIPSGAPTNARCERVGMPPGVEHRDRAA